MQTVFLKFICMVSILHSCNLSAMTFTEAHKKPDAIAAQSENAVLLDFDEVIEPIIKSLIAAAVIDALMVLHVSYTQQIIPEKTVLNHQMIRTILVNMNQVDVDFYMQWVIEGLNDKLSHYIPNHLTTVSQKTIGYVIDKFFYDDQSKSMVPQMIKTKCEKDIKILVAIFNRCKAKKNSFLRENPTYEKQLQRALQEGGILSLLKVNASRVSHEIESDIDQILNISSTSSIPSFFREFGFRTPPLDCCSIQYYDFKYRYQL